MSKFMNELMKLEGAEAESKDRFANVLRSTSPSVNVCFGKTHGLPFGYSLMLYGPWKGGKSWLVNDYIGQLHKSDPDAIAIKYDTEMRAGQLDDKLAKVMGIDRSRLITFSTNDPAEIFNNLREKVQPLLAKGMPVKFLAIDSLSGIKGRGTTRDTYKGVEQMFFGDHATTIGIGLKDILVMRRRYNIASVLVTQARSEQDQTKQRQGYKYRAQAASSAKHDCEWFLSVERNEFKDGRLDELKRELVDDRFQTQASDRGDATGHRAAVCMEASSFGADGRVGEFTIDYQRGIVNTHEELLRLGIKWKIIGRPNKVTHVIGSHSFNGKPATLDALEKDPILQRIITDGLLKAEQEERIQGAGDGDDEGDDGSEGRGLEDALGEG